MGLFARRSLQSFTNDGVCLTKLYPQPFRLISSYSNITCIHIPNIYTYLPFTSNSRNQTSHFQRSIYFPNSLHVIRDEVYILILCLPNAYLAIINPSLPVPRQIIYLTKVGQISMYCTYSPSPPKTSKNLPPRIYNRQSLSSMIERNSQSVSQSVIMQYLFAMFLD